MAENDRATCWSITINNPTEEEIKDGNLLIQLPAGWSCQGQMELGENGTPHYQAMLKTTQVRFAAVKKVFPRAHIEQAKNRKALEKYVHKPETRIGEVNNAVSNIPTLFAYQHTIASRWNDDEFDAFVRLKRESMGEDEYAKYKESDLALDYVDYLVGQDIIAGVCGIEYIAINPMWRSAWKKFYRQLVTRERKLKSQQDIYNAAQEVHASQSPQVSQSPQDQKAYGECESRPSADCTEVHLQNEVCS